MFYAIQQYLYMLCSLPLWWFLLDEREQKMNALLSTIIFYRSYKLSLACQNLYFLIYPLSDNLYMLLLLLFFSIHNILLYWHLAIARFLQLYWDGFLLNYNHTYCILIICIHGNSNVYTLANTRVCNTISPTLGPKRMVLVHYYRKPT